MELIFLNILLIGAGLLLWLFIRALPRMDEAELAAQRGMFNRWLTSQLLERVDAYARAAFLRTLRRIKVFVLRLDNGITQKLQRMKLASGEGIKAPKINLKKVMEERAMAGKDQVIKKSEKVRS